MASVLFQSSWTSIIFEGRNKFYGAYEIRQSYERNMLLGLFITCVAVGAATLCTAWVLNFPGQNTVIHPELKGHVFEVLMNEKIFTVPKQEFTKPVAQKVVRSFIPTPVQDPVVEIKPLNSVDAIPGNDVVTDNAGNTGDVPAGDDTGNNNGITKIAPSLPDVTAKPEIGSFASVMPVFDGSIQKYIAQNFNYPLDATRMGVDGRMVVEIILDEKGKVISARVLKGLGYGCDEEALRTVMAMPDWKPAMHGNHPVKIRLNIPITLKMD